MFTKRKSDPKEHISFWLRMWALELSCRGLNPCCATHDLYDLELVTSSLPVSSSVSEVENNTLHH